MTIARRLLILLAVPLLALVGLGIFTRVQLAEIETKSRFVAESRIQGLATLGNLSRSFAELRINVRSYLLATNDAKRATARSAFDDDEREVIRLIRHYADNLVAGDKDRRMMTQYHSLGSDWIQGAKQVMSLVEGNRRDGRPHSARQEGGDGVTDRPRSTPPAIADPTGIAPR